MIRTSIIALLTITALTCESAFKFDPVSAPVRHVSYWFLVFVWVNSRRRSTAELGNLIEAADKVAGQGSRKSPALVVLKKKAASA